jgi:hypothetical protein
LLGPAAFVLVFICSWPSFKKCHPTPCWKVSASNGRGDMSGNLCKNGGCTAAHLQLQTTVSRNGRRTIAPPQVAAGSPFWKCHKKLQSQCPELLVWFLQLRAFDRCIEPAFVPPDSAFPGATLAPGKAPSGRTKQTSQCRR